MAMETGAMTATEGVAEDGAAENGAGALRAAFPGESEMAARWRAFEWAATPLGPVSAWPQSLRTTAAAVLTTGFPSIVLWGPSLVQLYNDGYVPFLGVKHPWGLGLPTRECWPEVWDFNGPIYERVLAGETVTLEDQHYPLRRRGADATPDDVYITLSYAPVRDETGGVGGVSITLLDTTAQVAGRAAEAERARLLAELGAERERLRALILQIPVPVALQAGPEHRYALVNDAFRRISGGRDVTGLSVREAFPTLAGQGIWELFDRVYATGEPWVGPQTLVHYDRLGTGAEEDAWFDLRYEPVRDADGRVTGILNVSSDVTEHVRARQQVERLLAESERARGEADAANAQLREQGLELELSNQQLQDQTVELETQAEELQATAAQLEERTEEAEAAQTSVVGTLEAMADAFFALDADFRIVAVNAAMERGTGQPRSALLGRSMWDAFPGTVGNAFEQAYRGAAEGAEAHFTHDYSDGRLELITEVDVYPAPADGVAVFWRDVTAQVRADAERERLLADAQAARREAEAANRSKGEFLAVMSHELRTPLNAIGGYTELLEMGLRGPITEEQRQDLGRIQASQRHLLGLVNQVLDLAKDEAGALRVEREAVRSGDTVDAALGLVRPQAAAKGLVLNSSCEGAVDRQYLGDEPRVRQALVNLLANAIKFTEPGGRVRVECRLTDTPPADATLIAGVPYLALRVEDTGVGIPIDQQTRLFEPFIQVESGVNAYTRATGGTGLGLAISRRLARLMGGDLTVDSHVGRGSTFTLWLPTPDLRATPRATATVGAASTPDAPAAASSAATVRIVGTGDATVDHWALDHAAFSQESAGGAPYLVQRIGDGLIADARMLLRAWVARLHSDKGIPPVITTDDLEDHGATFITDIGLALRALDQSPQSTTELVEALRDSRAILAVVAERHGAQRARLGWPAAAVVRELELLGEVLDAAVVRLAGPANHAAVDQARAAVVQLLAQALRVSLGGFRLVAESDPRS